MPSRENKRINPTGIRLRRSFEQRALRRMFEHIDNAEDPIGTLCRLMNAYCQLLRQDAALEKSRPMPKPRRPAGETSADGRPLPAAAEGAALAQAVRDLYGVTLSEGAADTTSGSPVGEAGKAGNDACSRSQCDQN